MTTNGVDEYRPDYAVPPGATLKEVMDELGMTQAELAQRTGRPKKTINEIIKGKTAITPETALQLELTLGVPARLWNNLERNYQDTLARLAEEKRLEKETDWLKSLPVAAMISYGWIEKRSNKVEQLHVVFKFFGVVSVPAWNNLWERRRVVGFRQSSAFQSNHSSIVAWLRKGELDARKIECGRYSARSFRNLLNELKALTREPTDVFMPELQTRCAQVGVAVVFTPELPKTHISGAARWLTPGRALIQLSLRYRSDDQFWFTFFHEAGHVLQGKRQIFLDGETGGDSAPEQDANGFASRRLIPKPDFQALHTSNRISAHAIESLASRLGIAPGIVVGRLQHEQIIPHSRLNHLKRRLDWPKQRE